MRDDAQKIRRYHELTMYVVVTLSFAAVFANGAGLIMNALFALTLPLSWVAHQRGWTQEWGENIWNALIFVFIGVTAVRIFGTESSAISGGIQFIMLLLMLRLLSRRGQRDEWQIYALTFLLMATGTAVNEDIAYGFAFTLYVFLGTFGLALFHLKNEMELDASMQNRLPLLRVYMIALSILASLIVASSITLFFTIPRVGLGFFAEQSRSPTSMVGFNDKIELGSHGAIRNNPTVVMRVEFPDQPPPQDRSYEGWHWRMMSFDTYDGQGWSRKVKPYRKPSPYRREDGFLSLRNHYTHAMRQLRDDKPVTHLLKVYLEPLGTRQLPVLWPTSWLRPPSAVNIPFNPKRGSLSVDGVHGDILFAARNEAGVLFEMERVEPVRLSEDLVPLTERRDPDYKPEHLALPEGLDRLRGLAQEVAGDIENPWSKAKAIELHLQTKYSYTLNLPEVDPNNPIEAFLFETKRGHCEYFASSMALMMRAQGVPSRVVNGFLGGTWNEVGEYLAVRQGDAHSWVEVYMPKYGWIPFDPTPSSEADFRLRPEPGPLRFLRSTYDTMRMNWMKWVIEYDLNQQIASLRQLGRMLDTSRTFGGSGGGEEEEQNQESVKIPWNLILLYGLYAGLCVVSTLTYRLWLDYKYWRLGATVVFSLLGGAWWYWYVPNSLSFLLGASGPLLLSILVQLWSHQLRSARRNMASALFDRLEEAGARAGHERRVDEGPAHYITRLIQAFPEARADLEVFRQAYLRARFAQQDIDPPQRRVLQDVVRRLRKVLTRR